MRRRSPVTFALGCLLIVFGPDCPAKERPLLKDFAGLCVHTVQFKPELYKPVTSVVRDYHPLKWDLGDETSYKTQFPLARNRVDWSEVYGAWKKAGYRTSASIMFDDVDAGKWKDVKADAYEYGKAFARYFGPSGKELIEAAEVGNEPGKYDDASYRTVFEAMARGFREGDPGMKVATCAMNLGPSGRYSKSVDLLKGLDSLWDILNIHIYPEVEGWPTWKRSYPEDPKIAFLTDLNHVLTWRRENAPDKQVWLTEWGYDSSTKPAPATGTFAKWIGNTDEQQANWIVRGYLVLATTEVDRAYLYFFDDNDEPHVHGSSGLTRNFKPKPAFHAVAYLQKVLGDYRLSKVIRGSESQGFAQEWVHGSDATKRVTVCWYPTGADREMSLPVAADRVSRITRLPQTEAEPEAVAAARSGESITLTTGERPVFVEWTAP